MKWTLADESIYSGGSKDIASEDGLELVIEK